MKQLAIKLTDKQHCLLTRIAKEEKRKLDDLMYMIISEGLGSIFCERSITVKKEEDEYTAEDKKQLATNKKLEQSKGWKDLNWEEKYEKGFDHIYHYLSNCCRDQKDFIAGLCESIEANIYGENGGVK